MSIKINSGNNLRVNGLGNSQSKKNLFSKLQYLTFSNLVPSTLDRVQEHEGHLDLESQEILSLLKGNIEKLADISGRVEFMMGELSHIIKKKNF